MLNGSGLAMQPSHVKTDDSALSRVDQALATIERGLNTFAGLSILGIMLLSVANIFARKLLNYPIPAFLDIMVLAVPVMAFLGLPYCQREGGHIRMDILIGHLHGRLRWLVEAMSTLFTLFIIAVLIYGSWSHAERALNNGDSTPVAYLPTWPIKALVSICLAMLLARLIIQFIGFSRAFVRNEVVAVAVPTNNPSNEVSE
jgi:TRAP-type C4-dicarboxylate transport system permease small subunit